MEAAQRPRTTSSTSARWRSGPSTAWCSRGGRALNLSVREFGLLVALARSGGGIVPREELYARVWGGAAARGDRSIDVYIHKLRVKLEAALPDWRFIHTHVGFGYRFSPEPSHAFHIPATRSVTGWPAVRCKPAGSRKSTNKEGLVRSQPMARRWRRPPCSRSASPRAAATTRVRRAARRAAARARRRRAKLGGTHQRRRRDLPAARLQRVGRATSRTAGHDGQLPGASARAAASPSSPRAPSTSARTDAAMKRRGDHGGQEEGRPGPHPDRARRGDGLLQRRRRSTRASSSTARRSPTSSSARSRSGTTPTIAAQNSGVDAAGQRHHGLPPLRRVGHDEELHRSSSPTTRPSGRAAPASTRRSSGRPAPAPRATTASPAASSRPTARSATSSRPTRCRTTSRPPP